MNVSSHSNIIGLYGVQGTPFAATVHQNALWAAAHNKIISGALAQRKAAKSHKKLTKLAAAVENTCITTKKCFIWCVFGAFLLLLWV